MTEDRFRRYRQSGAFGAYRTLFRNVVPELTLGKRGGASWSLGPGGSSLARYVNQRLPAAARPSDALFDDGSVRWKCWEGKEEAFWQQRGWQFWDTSGRTPLLPTVLASAETLPDEERDILKSLLFTAGSRRRIVVDYLALCPPVKTHVELCDLIARSTDLLKTPDGADVQLLPAFSRLADAGMDAIRSIWRVVAGDPRGAAIADLVADGALRGALDELGKASKQWLRLPQRSQFIHERVPTTLARDLAAAHSTSKQIRCLLLHHEHHGGGLKWFRLARDRVEARLPQNQLSTSDYRFRLWPLARLAAQCGFSTMRPVIAATVVRRDLETDDEDESP